jgi:Xaa-Pro aminopeptidase
MELSERLNSPISMQELERRWSAIRASMKAADIDVLVIQNNNDYIGGYVKYFTDLPATNGYPATVVFPRDDDMFFIGPGPFNKRQALPHAGDGIRRGVKEWLTSPSFASAFYTATYDADLADKALASVNRANVGLVGTSQMSVAFADHLRKNSLSKSKIVEASDLVDKIKVIKSPEEIELIKKTARMQDGAMRAAFAAAKPGMRDTEIAAIAQEYGQRHGSENGIYLCASAPLGSPCQLGQRHYQNRTISKGDYFVLLIEDNGPGGYYTELGRTCVFGKVPAQMTDEFQFTLEARKFTLERLVPGRPSAEIWNQYNAFMQKNGRPPESRLYCHGQGYDLVERPLIRHDEPMSIQENMNIVVHPAYVQNNMMSWVCDNYMIEANGPGARLHQYPEEITEIS